MATFQFVNIDWLTI